MADFRKWFFVLTVLALVGAVPASAQMSCIGGAGVTPIVRGEGLSELLGDLEITCTVTAPIASPVTVQSLTLILTTNVTSKLVSPTTFPGRTEIVLSVLQEPDVFVQGLLIAPNTVQFQNVAVSQAALPVGTTRTLRITNIRANATQVPVAVGIPNPIQTIVSIAAPITLAITNPIVTLGFVQQGLAQPVAIADPVTTTFLQCIDQNIPTVVPLERSFSVRFTEGIGTAFKTLAEEHGTQFPPGTPGLEVIGEIGTATNATGLFLRFSGVPAGARVFVSRAAAPGSDIEVELRRFGTPNTLATATITTVATIAAVPYAEVPLTAGAGTAVYAVTGGTAPGIQNADIGVVVGIPTGIALPPAPLPAATVAGGFAPVRAEGTAQGPGIPIPRFIDTAQAVSAFTVVPCVTNLLFPYVTNQAGFDTGIAIVNTSLDNATGAAGTPPNQPFNTAPQSGTCTVYYFAGDAAAVQAAPQTTAAIPAGGMVAFALSQGGVPGATPVPAGFQGYIITRCNFQFAHGFAFVSDIGASQVSHGYLALIIPDRAGPRLADPFTTGGPGSGEQLAQ